MHRYRVGIIIPAFNEALTISSVVEQAKDYGIPIVVDDASRDGTGELAQHAGASLVTHDFNQGYDFALNSGFKKAAELNCQIVITLDADGQHNPVLIKQFIDLINEGYDVIVGIRSRQQRLAEHVFSWYARHRFNIIDPLCGMKAYRMDIYSKAGYFDSYGSVGTELVFFAAKNKCRIGQIPIPISQRIGASRFGSAISGNYRIFRSLFLHFIKSS